MSAHICDFQYVHIYVVISITGPILPIECLPGTVTKACNNEHFSNDFAFVLRSLYPFIVIGSCGTIIFLI